MTDKTLLVALLSVLAPSWGSAQSTFGDSFRNHVSIRQSLKDKNTVNEPAFATLTIPDEGANTNLIAAAATVSLYPVDASPRFNIAGAVQFNQNSTPGERQNVLTSGVEFEARFGGPRRVQSAENPTAAELLGTNRKFYFTRLGSTVGYKRNGEKHTDGLAADLYFTFQQNRPGSDSSAIAPWGDRLEFAPQLGIEFESALSAEKPEDEGQITRGMVSVAVNCYPLKSERLVTSAALAYRRDFRTDFPDRGRNHPFGQFGVTVFLDSSKVFSVGVERVVGDDPTQDIVDAAFTRFAFRVQLTRPQKRRVEEARPSSPPPPLPPGMAPAAAPLPPRVHII